MNDLDFYVRSQLYEKADTCALIFLQISSLIWIKSAYCHDLLMCSSLCFFVVVFFCLFAINFQEKELYVGDYVKKMFEIGLCSDG